MSCGFGGRPEVGERWRTQYVEPQYNPQSAICEPQHDTFRFASGRVLIRASAGSRTNAMASVFPAPDHDHARCSADAMAHAEALCVKRGERLTAMRRHVLEVLSASHKPLGAYEIIDLVAARGPRPAPITIYRALD